jgi:aminoglycoside phosphotransferase (APT) family kinase protein
MSTLSADLIETYLAHKLGQPVKVEKIEAFPRGISRETWFIDASHDGRSEKFVVRRDPDGNSIGVKPLRFEYDVYARLQGSGVPVAEVLGWEEDNEWAQDGRPFYLRRQVEGTWDIPNYENPDPSFNKLRLEIGREHVRKLAIVHSCDWRELGFHEILPVPPSESECAGVAVERMFTDLKRLQFSPLPIIYEVKEWLLDNAPRAHRISLCKGTNGLGEEVFRDGVIVAMSDWEQAALGDGASDFARMQEFSQDVFIDGEQVWGISQALEYYEELTGIVIPLSSVQYYRVLAMVENAITLHNGARPIAERSNLSVRPAWLAIEVLHGMQRLMMAAMRGRMKLTSAIDLGDMEGTG